MRKFSSLIYILLGISIATASAVFAQVQFFDTHDVRGALQLDGVAVPTGATIAVGAEASNAINVTIQLTDNAGADMAVRGCVNWWLSDDAEGDDVTSTGPATSLAIGTDGVIVVEYTAKITGLACSEADGDIDITLTETGTPTWYLCVVLPHGNSVCSAAITFA